MRATISAANETRVPTSQNRRRPISNLMKITTYITKIEDRPLVAEARNEVFSGELPASTLIVVKQLFHADFLVEIEGIAAV